MLELVFLQDLAIVMAVSAAIVMLSSRLHIPVVLGYILTGLVIGPHTPPFPLVTDLHSIHTLSELGVIFLLFSIGLEFSFTKLLKVGAVSVIAATVEILLMIWIGFAAGRAFGWSAMDSLFLGRLTGSPECRLNARSCGMKSRSGSPLGAGTTSGLRCWPNPFV